MSSNDPSALRLNVITLFSGSLVCTNTAATPTVFSIMLLDTSFLRFSFSLTALQWRVDRIRYAVARDFRVARTDR